MYHGRTVVAGCDGWIDAAATRSGRQSTTIRDSDSFVSEDSSSLPVTERHRRVIQTRPGKLGLIIDSSDNGPRVAAVKPSSQLYGAVFQGDLLVDVDGSDTTAMAGPELTNLMRRTAKRSKKITKLNTVTPNTAYTD